MLNNKGKGRKKIEMKKMKKESNLKVTFSKRRFGLFKKASELCTLCGVQILMIVFSPGGKAFTFGHPNPYDLIDRVLNRNKYSPLHQSFNNQNIVEIRPNQRIQMRNAMLTELQAKHEVEKLKRKDLDYKREQREKNGKWYETDVNKLDVDETNSLISSLQDLKMKLLSEISKYYHLMTNPQCFFGDNSGSIGPRQNFGSGGTNHFDQNTMVDLSALNYGPNMTSMNFGPCVGYYNNGLTYIPESNMNYVSEISMMNYVPKNDVMNNMPGFYLNQK